jgi:acetoacetyl-CoA synthetase
MGESSSVPDERVPARTISVFVMPGIRHQEASIPGAANTDFLVLARLRYALRDIRFVPIQYPDWRTMLAAKADPEAFMRTIIEQIFARCGEGPIFLAGYSFGGVVAFESAHRLVGAGHRVAFLGLLDAPRPEGARLDLDGGARYAGGFPRKLARAVVLLLFRMLIAVGAFRLLRYGALPLIRIGGPRVELGLQTLLRWRCLQKWQNWRIAGISVPTVLFRCEDHEDPVHDYGWSRVCPVLRVVPVGGDHLSLFAPQHMDRLAASFGREVRAAG